MVLESDITHATKNIRNLFLRNQIQANEVLNKLISRARLRGEATVGDLYTLLNWAHDLRENSPNCHMGWRLEDLRGIQIIQLGRGYSLTLPAPKRLG